MSELWEVVAEIQDPRNSDIWHKYAFTHDTTYHLVQGFPGATPEEAWHKLGNELMHDLRNTERTGTLAHTHLGRREFVREAHRVWNKRGKPDAAAMRDALKVQVVVRSTVAAIDPEESDMTSLWSKDHRFARLLRDYLNGHGPIHEIGTEPAAEPSLADILIPDDPSQWVRRA